MYTIALAVPRQRTRAKSTGFTLLEIMVVVAIIAIIAAIITPNFTHARSNAQVATTTANEQQIATALEMYYMDAQGYPTGTAVAVTSALMGTMYLNTNPTNPGDGTAYLYTKYTSGNGYVIYDTASYDRLSLQNLPRASSFGATGIVLTGYFCGPGGCWRVARSSDVGTFGY